MCIANLGVSLKVIKILLTPFTAIYWMITTLRNYLYDQQVFKSVHFSPFVICVGNLRVGGTGKSPMIEYLARLLQQDHPVAILSRGYKRQTQGIRIATQEDTSQTLGDEPYQFFRKFNNNTNPSVIVAVGEERILAVPEILYHHPDIETILLDDAFQHRAIAANLNILITEFARPFFEDTLLPVGRLRESRKGAVRADVVIVSKCPVDITAAQKQSLQKNIRKFTLPGTVVYFTAIRYLPPTFVWAETNGDLQKVLLVSGIGNPNPLEQYVKTEFELADHLTYADHHLYTEKDLQQIRKVYDGLNDTTISILTTEKDMGKLVPLAQQHWKNMPLYYLPIETFFLESQSAFDQFVKNKAREHKAAIL